MKSYLLSTLGSTARSRGKDTFLAGPRHWLVWEPGSWKPPQRQTTQLAVTQASLDGQLPVKAAEALVIALEWKGRQLVLGRAAGCDLVINDGTLSSRHMGFTEQHGGWVVEDLNSTNGTAVDGVALRPGLTAALRDGARLGAGSVVLTFHSSEGLWPRLSKG